MQTLSINGPTYRHGTFFISLLLVPSIWRVLSVYVLDLEMQDTY